MSRRMIGGVIDARGLAMLAGVDDEYRQRADQHRPDLEGLRSEALRLLAEGLQVRDVAAALRVAEDQVRAWKAAPRP